MIANYIVLFVLICIFWASLTVAVNSMLHKRTGNLFGAVIFSFLILVVSILTIQNHPLW